MVVVDCVCWLLWLFVVLGGWFVVWVGRGGVICFIVYVGCVWLVSFVVRVWFACLWYVVPVWCAWVFGCCLIVDFGVVMVGTCLDCVGACRCFLLGLRCVDCCFTVDGWVLITLIVLFALVSLCFNWWLLVMLFRLCYLLVFWCLLVAT